MVILNLKFDRKIVHKKRENLGGKLFKESLYIFARWNLSYVILRWII